jgi:hypothetical protein
MFTAALLGVILMTPVEPTPTPTPTPIVVETPAPVPVVPEGMGLTEDRFNVLVGALSIGLLGVGVLVGRSL